MNGQPVPTRESHRDSRVAKVTPKIGTSKPRRKKFSTEFSTIAAPSPPKMVTFSAPEKIK